VTSTDYVPELLEQGRRRAEADGLVMRSLVADAEDLPFADGEFDVALSTFGVMFAPNPHRAAAELLRVVMPGGRIGLANWTPSGFVGQLFDLVSRFVPSPAGIPSPLEWGTETRLVELFGRVRASFAPNAGSSCSNLRPRTRSTTLPLLRAVHSSRGSTQGSGPRQRRPGEAQRGGRARSCARCTEVVIRRA
jgi:SAM-dependent methyltransferase